MSESNGLMPIIQALHKALGIEGWSSDAAASQNLAMQPGGSVMANYSEPTAASKFLQENPLLKTILDMVKLGAPSPSDAGGSKAMLGPIGRVVPGNLIDAAGAKAVNQSQKKIVKALFRGDPETLKEVVASPQMLHVGVPGASGGLKSPQSQSLIDEVMQGAFAHMQPGSRSSTIRVDPNVMRGLHPGSPAWNGLGRGAILKNQGVEGLPDMVTHEATHFLNEPAFDAIGRNTPFGAESDALNKTTAQLAERLKPFIHHAKYGPAIVNQHLRNTDPSLAVNEALSYLSQPSGRHPAATWLHNALTSRPREGGIGQFPDNTQQRLQDVIDSIMQVPELVRK